ncbi:MAG TPA: tRNA (N(6)-L-threonylcarbamoyladenosine(37)-C(2))-methylthiotransferase MtaB [Candidatus Fusicatenibacter merdavium]|uniref:Threonylcarbamoyladenosine tRNA methylthiotransferase MtaB n=1 Tax=Candidatus Fusicatenibacter merdavium TaxID=2838600 RepID=A0A9D2BJD9_9FIRM|nr:tRNA (N(6)-L-threonylcarbamoyladenosine(37)-C(2))-methylthiotransferase MtaB [Candidatus Fusicatenibacter merdavium]
MKSERKKAALHNLGCKVNAYELEAIQQMLEQKGYEIVPFASGADVYIINTCTVTNIADRKSRQMLHKAKKMNPDAVVVACGCYVQAAGEKLEEDTAIDLIVGNNKKKEIPEILEAYFREREEGRAASGAWLTDMAHNREYETLSISRTEEHTRAFIKVQDGCNQFCTYCIIPYARGRVRSRRPEEVLAEVQRLAASGCQEIVLTGIHLSSYGVDLEEEQDLLALIRTVHSVEGIRRIRLGSLEPGIITESFAEAIAALPKVCPHFHLSLQSGCDTVLQRMNRRYRSEEYMEKCRLLRRVYDRPALTTDVIVGFPGETEEEFEASRAFVEQVHFFETHIFKYSRREGTCAAAMPGQISEQEKTRRSHVLLELDGRRRREYMESFLGEERDVLFEERVQADGREYWTGHTREYLKVLVPAEKEDYENQMIPVKLTEIWKGDALFGKVSGR